MYYAKHRRTRRDRQARLYRAAAVMLAAVMLTVILGVRLRSVVKPALEIAADDLYSTAVNDALLGITADADVQSLVSLSTGADGTVTAVETDAAEVNRVRAEVCGAVIDALADGCAETEIPIGSLTGVSILAGRGPALRLRLVPRGGVTAELHSSLTAAGINQTRHTISCVVTARMYAMLPGMSLPVELSTTVMLAESVIVGSVPDAYTYVVGDSADTIGRIFDYGYPNGIQGNAA